MHRVFGTKENVEYLDREGAYLIPFRNSKVGVIQTSKGYFFLGGGLESGENHEKCLDRECVEEVGCLSYVKDKICSAESLYKYEKDPDIGIHAGWPPHKSVEESLDIIKNVLRGKESYAICEKNHNEAIGAIALKLYDIGNVEQ